MADWAFVPDGTEPLAGYVRRDAALWERLQVAPVGDPVVAARRQRRRDRRRYLALCRLLRRPAGTPLRVRVLAADGAQALTLMAPDRGWIVTLPPGRLDDPDWDAWGYVRRELRRAVDAEPGD